MAANGQLSPSKNSEQRSGFEDLLEAHCFAAAQVVFGRSKAKTFQRNCHTTRGSGASSPMVPRRMNDADGSSSGDSDRGVLLPCRSASEAEQRRRRASVETAPSTPNATRWSFRDLFRRSPGHHGGDGRGTTPASALPSLPPVEDDGEGTADGPDDEDAGPSELDTPCEPSRRRRGRRGNRADGEYRRSTGHDAPLGGDAGRAGGAGGRKRRGIPSTIFLEVDGGDDDDDDGTSREGVECHAGGSVALSDVTPFTFGDEIAEVRTRLLSSVGEGSGLTFFF